MYICIYCLLRSRLWLFHWRIQQRPKVYQRLLIPRSMSACSKTVKIEIHSFTYIIDKQTNERTKSHKERYTCSIEAENNKNSWRRNQRNLYRIKFRFFFFLKYTSVRTDQFFFATKLGTIRILLNAHIKE